MSNRVRRLDEAVRLLDRQLTQLGDEFRGTRLREGLTLEAVADAVGVSRSTIQRTEAGRSRHTNLATLVRHGAALGLRTSIKVFPVGPPLHDAPQLTLIGDLRTRIEPAAGDGATRSGC